MIFLNEIIRATNYSNIKPDKYCWDSFGKFANLTYIEVENASEEILSFIYDYRTQEVFLIHLSTDDTTHYQWVSKNHFEKYNEECIKRGYDVNKVYDDSDIVYINVDDETQILQQISSIFENITANNLSNLDFVLDDDLILPLAKMAHERDITLNQLITEIISNEVLNKSF